MSKLAITSILVAAILVAGMFAFMPVEKVSTQGGGPARDNVIVHSITLTSPQRMVIVDNAGIGGTSDVEVTWRFNPAVCRVQVFDGTTFTNLANDGAFGGNPAHADSIDVEAVVLTAINATAACTIDPTIGQFVTVSTVGR